MNKTFKMGDLVRIVVLHDGLKDAPPETVAIYKNAYMRPHRVDDIGHKDGLTWVQLNVNDDGSQGKVDSKHGLSVPFDEVELITEYNASTETI